MYADNAAIRPAGAATTKATQAWAKLHTQTMS